MGSDATGQGKIVHGGLVLRVELKTSRLGRYGNKTASLFDVHLIEIDDQIVKSRIVPIDPIQIVNPPLPLPIPFPDVPNDFFSTQLQLVLGHADSKVQRRNGPDSQDCSVCFQKQMPGIPE